MLDQVVVEGDAVYQNLLTRPQGEAHCLSTASVKSFSQAIANCYGMREAFDFGICPVGLNLRGMYQKGRTYIFLCELLPGPRTMKWLAKDSPAPYGSKAKYIDVRVSLPWQYFFVTIDATGCIGHLNSVYFRNQPLNSSSDRLFDCHFYNCSVEAYGVRCWICVQGYSNERSGELCLLDLVAEFISWFWFSGFNASSEHYEGDSWWGRNCSKVKDPRVRSIEAWTRATEENPNFAMEVNWLDSGYTAADIFEEMSARIGWQPYPLTVQDYAALVRKCAR